MRILIVEDEPRIRDFLTRAFRAEGFTATATHPDVPVPSNATPLHYPTLSIDQTMQVHQGN